MKLKSVLQLVVILMAFASCGSHESKVDTTPMDLTAPQPDSLEFWTEPPPPPPPPPSK